MIRKRRMSFEAVPTRLLLNVCYSYQLCISKYKFLKQNIGVRKVFELVITKIPIAIHSRELTTNWTVRAVVPMRRHKICLCI